MKRFLLILCICIICLFASCTGNTFEDVSSSTVVKATNEESMVMPTLQSFTVKTATPTKEPTPIITATPEATPTPTEPSEKISLYDALPQPTPVYEPTKEDLAFKQQVISEGKTLAFDMTEWELIDIMCNKLGIDEYLYRLKRSDNYQNELYLWWTRDEPEGTHYTIYILDAENGDLFYRDEVLKEYIVGNIFTSEDKEEPFRLSEYNKEWLIEQFINKIYNGELPRGVEVEVGYSRFSYSLEFTTCKVVDGEIDYLGNFHLHEPTGELSNSQTRESWYLFD